MKPVTKPVRGKRPDNFGGYTLYSRAKLPSTRVKVRQYLKNAREGLFKACNSGNPSVPQELLIDRIITCLGIVRSQEQLAVSKGVTGAIRLPENHLSYCSQISRDLKALGINGKSSTTGRTDKTTQAILDRIDGKQ